MTTSQLAIEAGPSAPSSQPMDEFVSRYCVTKHSWKGRYVRVFCISRSSIATINPATIFKATNKWEFVDGIVDCIADPKSLTDFTLMTKSGKSTSSTTFSAPTHEERTELLTDVQSFRLRFDMQWAGLKGRYCFRARKYKSNEEWGDATLTVTNIGVEQRNAAGDEVGTYYFLYIKGFARLTDKPNAVVIKYAKMGKLHQYLIEGANPSDFIGACNERATKYLGCRPFPELEPMSSHGFDMNRLGVDRDRIASISEFPVMKTSFKHRDAPVRRVLATTEECVIERDPATYNCTSAYYLADVYALVRSEEDEQRFMIEYKDPYIVKVYTSPVRDALLAHLVDACRAAGNTNAAVIMRRVDRGKRASPCRCFVNEEIESTLLKCLIEPHKGGGSALMPFSEVVEFFNANVEYNGLRFTENRDGIFAENREKLIFQALTALLEKFPHSNDPNVVIQQFYALRRLTVTRIGFSSAAIIPSLVKAVGALCVKALRMHHTALSHAVIDFLNTLMTPQHENYHPYHEQVNKNRLLASDSFLEHLMALLKGHIESDSGALVIQALLDFFVYAVCPPYAESTAEENFKAVIQLIVDSIGKSVFLLFGHHCKAIRFSAGNIIRVIMEEGDEDQFFQMQRAALSEGGYLRQFQAASFGPDRNLRDLARKLVAYWTYENQTAQDLLRRMLPLTLLHFLKSDELPPEGEREKQVTLGVTAQTQEFLDSKQGFFKKTFRPQDTLKQSVEKGEETDLNAIDTVVVYRQRKINIELTLNWALFFYQIKVDHLRPDLIWNHNTRTELKDATEGEIQAFQMGLEFRKDRNVCWNYQEFEVQYPSLANELRIGNHYPRLLFESQNPVVARPKEFFNDMYHRFLLVQDFNMKNQCLHGMSLLYKHYAEEIGVFNDIEYMVKMLEHASHPTFRDRMLSFLANLLKARLNVKPFIDCNGVKPLVDLLPLAHLHIDRPQIHSVTNAIECSGSPVDLQDQEKEWHYTNKAGEKCDPVSYTQMKRLITEGVITPTTKVWAQGLGGWRDVKDVPQLKWGVLLKDLPSVMTLSEVTATILDIFLLLCAYYPSRDPDGSVMQPLPRVKRFLSDPSVLPHITQLLLTFDPSICSRVHTLLHMLMEDNPLVPRFFLTGGFFFSLMYMGSDVLPLCRLLFLTHRQQSFRIQHDNEIIRTSILSVLLPPALVCFLHNHGAIKFAEVFLGEYETPEAIWGKDMRRYLVEKIAAHISDFTPRLLGNMRAVYQYCPIVGVEYDQLKNELFCSQYYLKHFCDELRYPNWPVGDPVALMRDCLVAWKLELEKEPCLLNKDKCLEELEMKEPNPTPQQVRKAYFKLAAVYHPDKNPNGREKFEAIQAAYEFLVSDKVYSDAPDPNRIALLLKCQAILFKRFSEAMSKYKYAGYGLLTKLLEMENADNEMLRKEPCLVDPAMELCYYTVHNAPLNADELLQEGGIDLINTIMVKCFETISIDHGKDTDHNVSVAKNGIRIMNVAAAFPDCMERMLGFPTIPFYAAKAIAYEKMPALNRAAIHCTESLCGHPELQRAVTEAGAVWHLLRFLFRFDYTLEDAGMEFNEENHTQLFANRAAKGALKAIYALVGFQPDDSYLKTEANVPLYKVLQGMLTPYVVNKMRFSPGDEGSILKIVNSNHETPYLLWNNQTRAELIDFLENNSEACVKAGLHSKDLPPLSLDDFSYTNHAQELIVAGIFIRVYNLQPTFALEDPGRSFQSILAYVEREVLQGTEERPAHGIAAVMEALKNIMVAYPSVHPIAEKYMPVLIKALSLRTSIEDVNKTFVLLTQACSHLNCVEAVGKIPTAASETILAMQYGKEFVEEAAVTFIRQIVVEKHCVQQVLDRGLYIVLLHAFATSRNPKVKEDACQCVARASSDKLNGPKVTLRAAKIIPLVMIETMKEDPTKVPELFERYQETPELVWNTASKAKCIELLSKARSNIEETMTADLNAYWKLPDDIAVDTVEDLQVGGVYLSLFMKQPNWNLRKPKDFLMAMLEKFVEVCANTARNEEVLALVTDSMCSFLSGQPSVCDFIVALGYIGKIARLCEVAEPTVAVSSLRVFHEIANSRTCVESMSKDDVVASVLRAQRHTPEDVFLVMDTLERLMVRSSDKANMLRLALNNQLPQKLLALLETGMTAYAQPAQQRAITVKVLKAMAASVDPIYGPQIQGILQNSPVWQKYRDQSHELFLTTNQQFGGYLTGPKQGAFLSLAAPPGDANDSEPPPL